MDSRSESLFIPRLGIDSDNYFFKIVATFECIFRNVFAINSYMYVSLDCIRESGGYSSCLLEPFTESIAFKTASAFHTSGIGPGTTESARRIVIKSRTERNLQRKKRSSAARLRRSTILVSPAAPVTNEIFVPRTARPCAVGRAKKRDETRPDARAGTPRGRRGGDGRTARGTGGTVIGIDRDFPRDKPRRMGHSYMRTE